MELPFLWEKQANKMLHRDKYNHKSYKEKIKINSMFPLVLK